PPFNSNMVRSELHSTVTRGGIQIAEFTFEPFAAVQGRSFPTGTFVGLRAQARDPEHQLSPGTVHFTELAPHLFTVDLDSLNTRVPVAEFSDSPAILEGAFGSDVCDVLSRAIQQRFHKPVRQFAFSHLHGQYSGGTRSWVHEGATVVIPPTTEPLI